MKLKNLSEFLSSINTERNNLIASGIESFTEERKQEILKKYDDLISSWQEALNKAKIKEKDKYYVDEENLLDRIRVKTFYIDINKNERQT